MSITVILNVYKRPNYLIEQIRAVQNQSVKPTNIIIYKNFVEGVEIPSIPDEINNNISIIESKNKNFGVWGRFAVALVANTEYICVCDDDTIPMPKWFENCLNTMNIKPGLLGTNGVIFSKGDNYAIERNVGTGGFNNEITEVDIVGQSWFFKREWLHYLWEYTPNYDNDLAAGEDIAFSANLQKHGIKTYVPPHPENNKDLHGRSPETGLQYGLNAHATSYTGMPKFDIVLKDFINNRGFITLNNKVSGGNKKKYRKTKTKKYKKSI
uniref:Glycosyltransferase 2-like domain-containing protein n=1 Tax=viral metagenome TaxID=1070528 RepID=A0A6C0D877_9ZZZZ